jgi:hypothetical protein
MIVIDIVIVVIIIIIIIIIIECQREVQFDPI